METGASQVGLAEFGRVWSGQRYVLRLLPPPRRAYGNGSRWHGRGRQVLEETVPTEYVK